MTLGNSHDVPVATFLSTGHVPVTSQGATFLQPHGKGRAMLTDEETRLGEGTEGSRSRGYKEEEP